MTPYKTWLKTRNEIAASFERENPKPHASKGPEARAQWTNALHMVVHLWERENRRPSRTPEEEKETNHLRRVHRALTGGHP